VETIIYSVLAALLLLFCLYVATARVRRKFMIADKIVRELTHETGHSESHLNMVKAVAASLEKT